MNGSETSEPNGFEDESPQPELEPSGGEMDQAKAEKFFKTIYGDTSSQEDGVDVEGYPAISRGVNRTIPTQALATLIFRNASGDHQYNVLESVPQKVQCNWLFLVDLKKLSKQTDIYYDGLGAWDQNCGKITNYFRYVNGEARDAKDQKADDVVQFIRRTDRNVNCKAFNRVVVTCQKFGTAAVQYFFKSRDEGPFEISSVTPKTVRLSTLSDSPSKSNRVLKRKAGAMTGGEDADVSGEIMYLTATGQDQPVPVRVTALKNIKHGMDSSLNTDNGDASTLLAYLRNFVSNTRQERAEERLLRREELELRKKERTEDLQWRKEEADLRKKERQEDADLRKQEMGLERSRLALEQQRWEIDRKEKEMFLELLRKKLLD